MLLSQFYIFLYFFYIYVGYNFIYRPTLNKAIDYALINPKAFAFIGKRIFMLSQLTLLYSSIYLQYSTINRYLNVVLLHLIVNTGYFIKWGVDEYSTFYMHVFWALPVVYNGFLKYDYLDYTKLQINNENIYLFVGLLLYIPLQKYIYTGRNKYIDNPR